MIKNLILSLLVLVSFPTLGKAAIAVAQVATCNSSAGTAVCTFGSSTSTGSAFFIQILAYVPYTGITVTDSNLNSYSVVNARDEHSANNAQNVWSYVVANGTGGVAHAITVAITSSDDPANVTGVAYEITGAATSSITDQAVSAEGNGSAPSSGNISATVSGITLGCGWVTGGNSTYGQPSGYTESYNAGASFVDMVCGYKIQGAGTYAYDPTSSLSGDWLAMIAHLKEAGAVSALRRTSITVG